MADHKFEISEASQKKWDALKNPKLTRIIKEMIQLMKPKEVLFFDDSEEDLKYAREYSLKKGEEMELGTEGHTLHFDGFKDQGRDKDHTKVLLPEGQKLSRGLNYDERESCLKEIKEIMTGVMEGSTMYVKCYCLGPLKSHFSLPALQITDSLYVVHSENILYRSGYQQFLEMTEDKKDDFFHFVHSAGALDERMCSINVDKRRIYIDPIENRVFTMNNQYAGNSLACKKLALRLAIYKANHEDWLTEHMFLSGFGPVKGGRKTFFTGAYPSACGKTSTAMIPGASMVGDDIVYIKEDEDGAARAVNIEQGVFGIIKNVCKKDDPVIFKALKTPKKEIIFSNVLEKDGEVYWTGMGKDIKVPEEGSNHSGKNWKKGTVIDGKDVPCSHSNSRFTLSIAELGKIGDEALHKPEGVVIDGVLYGGRDYATCVPVAECFDWQHGVLAGATLESVVQGAVVGKDVGQLKSSPMANMDFVIVPLGLYLENHYKFGKKLKKVPLVFQTNYFLQDEKEEFLNEKIDKKIWLHWAEGRVHKEYDAIKTPIGFIPKYEDLKNLFKESLDRTYTIEEYTRQFTIRVTGYLNKLDRAQAMYEEEQKLGLHDVPKEFWDTLALIRKRLNDLKAKVGKDEVTPEDAHRFE